MKNQDKVNHAAMRISLELENCFRDSDNGSSLINDDNYEDDVKDFFYGLILATGVYIEKLTGNEGDVIDVMSLLTRICFEYSIHE